MYKDLDLSKAQIFLVNHGHNMLNTFSQKSQEYAASMLEQRGVKLRWIPPLRKWLPTMCCSRTELEFLTRTVIWAGGLKASSLSDNLAVPPGHGGRIDVQPDLSVKDFAGRLRARRFCEHRWRGRQAFATACIRGGTVRKMVCKKHCGSDSGRTGEAFPLPG